MADLIDLIRTHWPLALGLLVVIEGARLVLSAVRCKSFFS